MTRVDWILLQTLESMGNVSPSKFRLIASAGVQYVNALRRIDILAAQGVLEIHRGPHTHIVRRKHTHE